MTVCGIDYSTRFVDVVLLDEDTDAATWHRFELLGQDAFERSRMVRWAMPTQSFWDDVLAIGIEDPRGYGAGSLYRVQGAILSRLPHGRMVHPLIPSQWRKTVGLPGNAPKAEVWAFVCAETHDRWIDKARRDWPQDACDAYCIALATRTLIQQVAA